MDIEKPSELIAYLVQKQRIQTDERPEITVLAGGVSNRTVLVERATGDSWVMKQALEKLRVSVDWFSSPERIHREALGMKWLAKFAPPGTIMPLVFEDEANHILAMKAVPLPHDNWKFLLLAGDLRSSHVVQFAVLLSAIHARSYEHRAEFPDIFQDNSFFLSLRIEPYYQYTAEQIPAAAQMLRSLIVETLDHRLTLVHGDYSPKNILVHHDALVLLDHEVIHIGDPAFDVGFALAHFLSKAHHLPTSRNDFAAAGKQFWSTYRKGLAGFPWHSDLEGRAALHTLACLLARVAGRSPLEYLSVEERSSQREAVLAIMLAVPTRIDDVIDQFIEKV